MYVRMYVLCVQVLTTYVLYIHTVCKCISLVYRQLSCAVCNSYILPRCAAAVIKCQSITEGEARGNLLALYLLQHTWVGYN